MLAIDQYAYNSELSKYAPKSKIIFGALPLLICLSFHSFAVSISTMLIMSIISIKYAKIPLLKYIKLISIPLSFLIISTVTIIFGRYEQNASVLMGFRFFTHTYGVTINSLQAGILIILNALGAISCMYFISVNTTMNDIFSALRLLRVPGLLLSLMQLTYRYIFVVLEEAHKIRIAQNSRLGYIDFKTSINSLGQLTGMLFLRTYNRADRVYAALQSRGYEGEFKTLQQSYLPSKKMYAYCILISFILIAIGFLERGLV